MIQEMQNFIDNKLYVGQRSKITLNSYSRWLDEFCDITKIKTLDDFLSLTEVELGKYVMQLNKKNQASSVRTKTMAVRGFYDYIIKKKDNPCKVNIMEEIEIGRPEIKELHPPSRDNIIDTLSELKKNKTYFVLISLISQTGLRINEALSIKISDLYDNSIKVIGKGNKERTIYLNEDTLKVINDFIENDRHEKPLLSKEEFDKTGWTKFNSYQSYADKIKEGKNLLFLSKTGIKMDDSSVRKTLAKYAKKAGVDLTKIQFSPHKLRTAFATNEMSDGMPVAKMKNMLGHSSIGTTMRYYHASPKQREESFLSTFNYSKALSERTI